MRREKQDTEARRVMRLHEAFVKIRDLCRAGSALTPQLKRLTSRTFRAPYCGYSLVSMRRLYAQWRRCPTPETLRRNYRSGMPRIPAALLGEFFHRLRRDPAQTISQVVQQMRAEWNQRMAQISSDCVETGSRSFPSVATFSRHLAAILPMSWGAQRRQRKAALSTLRRLDAICAAAFGSTDKG